MHRIGIPELLVVLFMGLLYGIPIAFAVWVIVAIKRLVNGIKRVSSRLDVVEKYLMDKEKSAGALENARGGLHVIQNT